MPIRFTIFLLLGLLPSCAAGPPVFAVQVTSLASSQSGQLRSYVLNPGNPEWDREDLQYLEFAELLNRALQMRDFVAADTSEQADLVILLRYQVSGPLYRNEYFSQAIWGQTGYRTAYWPRLRATRGEYYTYWGYFGEPTYGVTGYTKGVRTITSYAQQVEVVAYEQTSALPSQASKQVWSATMNLDGSSPDLRRSFPVMLAAALPYLGISSGQTQSLLLYEDDPVVQSLRGSAAPHE